MSFLLQKGAKVSLPPRKLVSDMSSLLRSDKHLSIGSGALNVLLRVIKLEPPFTQYPDRDT